MMKFNYLPGLVLVSMSLACGQGAVTSSEQKTINSESVDPLKVEKTRTTRKLNGYFSVQALMLQNELAANSVLQGLSSEQVNILENQLDFFLNEYNYPLTEVRIHNRLSVSCFAFPASADLETTEITIKNEVVDTQKKLLNFKPSGEMHHFITCPEDLVSTYPRYLCFDS
jgi:hypothetical protein